MTGTGLMRAICDPYGAESRIKLMGGLYPESYNGNKHWHCPNYATHRVIMVCKNNHRGEVMPLCDSHHGSIQQRQAGICLTCAFPPEARAAFDEIEGAMSEIQRLVYAEHRPLMGPEVMAWQRVIERNRVRMNELQQSGRIPKNPLRLIEVS
jgi:hypothetical protein